MTAAREIAPGLRLLCAPNPSPMTGPGTNTYMVGRGQVAVIDPGPDLPAHLDAILGALGPDERVSHILVTHAHLDHAGLARGLSKRTGAPVLAFGNWTSGRSPLMQNLAEAGIGGGEGVDASFVPDRCLGDGEEISGPGWVLRALWTPGHFGNHICLQWGDEIFTGDLVMGWASSLISPPDGDMGAYMASLSRIMSLGPRRLWPGHGDAVDDPAFRLAELVAHRRSRERAILAAVLAAGPAGATPAELRQRVYGSDLAPALFTAAERNVLAHLIDLHERGLVACHPAPHPEARFHRP
ncbi:MBL fold metallo-hydrolase [Halodurantibacterium flavum]|uniref:MBL fold metallo-hydrolase n=1 Tax=Halodurantibacterium flavum TaxID=1382802 RepID=A0ABW4S4S3_9RHOB